LPFIANFLNSLSIYGSPYETEKLIQIIIQQIHQVS
jgi:hypothetical protein